MRGQIKEKLEKLEEMNKNGVNYKYFEVALMLYLRSGLEDFDNISDIQLDKIFELTDNVNSLLDIHYEDIDYILNASDKELIGNDD